MTLKTYRFGEASSAPKLLIAHGLFGSARNWNVVARRLSEGREVISVDMRNHGESPFLPSHSYADQARDLAQVIEAEGTPVDLLGHSMGGKAAMMLALTRPELIRKLVVADIAPVAYGHSQTHLIEAMRSVVLDQIATRRDADQQLRTEVPEDGVRAFLLQSLDVKGKRWRLNHDVLEADMGKITGWPEDVKGRFEGPVFMLTGAASDYVLPQHRAPIREYFPQARFAKLTGAGHWLHADKPREFEAAVEAFLSA